MRNSSDTVFQSYVGFSSPPQRLQRLEMSPKEGGSGSYGKESRVKALSKRGN